MMATPDTVAAVRRFNRFYTRAIGVLGRAHLGGPYTLAETRVLYEIAHGRDVTSKAVIEATGLDAGYLSRILKRLERDGLLTRARSASDRRNVFLALTDAGRQTFAGLEARQEAQMEGLIAPLSSEARGRLTGALTEAERLLAAPPAPAEVVLRTHRPGDIGWIVQRHGELYWREYGWDERMEAMVARICADFVDNLDPDRERCWIAERGGERLGSIMLVKGEGDVAKLRLLLVEPSARGLGVGRRLVDECLGFARSAGYEGVTLWTQSVLTAARAIYAAVGFELVDSWPNRDFGGYGLTSERWDLRF